LFERLAPNHERLAPNQKACPEPGVLLAIAANYRGRLRSRSSGQPAEIGGAVAPFGKEEKMRDPAAETIEEQLVDIPVIPRSREEAVPI
jgi:hypothetical protein